MIRINLLAEDQAAEEMRRRDPVKRAIWAGGVLCGLMLVWIIGMQTKLVAAKRVYEQTQTEWKTLEKADGIIRTNLSRSALLERRLAALANLSSNRFLWSAPLNALQFSMIPDIEIIEITAKQTYTPTPAKIDPNTKKVQVPAAVTERISLTIKADDFAPANQANHTKFMDSVAKQPFFRDNLRRPDPLKFTERTPTPPEAESRRTASFSFECQFPEKVR